MALDDLDSAINIATGEVTKNDDPLSRLDSAIDNVVTTQKKRAATVTGIATKFNPDQIAQSRALGRQVGLPDDIAERNPDEVRRKFITQKVSELYDTSPVLGRKLSDPAFAKLSHDITDELAGQESAIKQLALTKQGFRKASELSRAMSDQQFSNIIERGRDRVVERGIGDVVGSFGRSIAAGSTGRIGQGVYGALASPFGVLAPLLEPLVGTVLPANPLRVAEQGLLNLSKQQSNVADAIAGDRSEQGFVEGAVNSGFESLGMNLPPLLAGVISNNPSLALNAMVSLTGGQEFAKAREQGLDANQALVYAGSQLGVEYFTEKLPVDTLFKGLRGETGLLKTLLLSNVQEQIGEQAATVLQDLNEWAVLNPDKPFAEYVKERPDAALQTAIATLVGTTGQVAIAKSIEVAGNYVSTEQEKLQYQSEAANSSMQAFANIQQLAEQSKLKQRSAQDFATFLQEAGGENGLDEVYIDARTFVEEAEKQGVDLNTLMQSSPVINQQLQEAIAQGVDLVIPVGEFGASIAGTEFGGAILQHLRADENGISAFEAQTQLDGAVEELQRQAEQVAQQYQDNEAWTQSIAEVSDNLLGQLNAVGRFTPQNNQAYVNGLVAPWYSTLASNLGITPSEAYARYPLQVSGNVTANGFEQNDIVGKNEALSSLSKLSQVVYDETYSPQDAYDALYEAANPKQKTVLRALSKEQMLGFEYPHQALDELRRNPEAYQTSPAFKGILSKAGNNQFNQSESQVDTPEFKAWFGDSKVVDADGKPLVVYHGTSSDFNIFKPFKNLIFVSKNPRFASEFASPEDDSSKPNVMPLYVKSEDPFDFENPNDIDDLVDALPPEYSDGRFLTTNNWVYLEDSLVVKTIYLLGFDGIYIRESGEKNIAVFSPYQLKSAIGNRGTFDPNDANILNQADIKELVAQHNLSAENLLFADRMGGLAVPSLAVTKKQHILEGFGEITLLAAPEMVDPKGYAKAKVFGADIYSPRYPRITYMLDDATVKNLNKIYAEAQKATGEPALSMDDLEDGPSAKLKDSAAVKYKFLKDNGIEPNVVNRELDADSRQLLDSEYLKPFISDRMDPFELGNNQEFVDAYMNYIVDRSAADGITTRDFTDDNKRNIARNAAYKLKDAVAASGGVVDRYATRSAISSQFTKELSDKFMAYVDGIASSLNAKEKLYNGRTPSGFKKYIDHTLENVVKALKKELRGGENWNYGLGSVRAKYTPEFKSIAEIRKNKSRLIDNGNFEDVKNEMDDALESISDGLESFHVFSGSVLENTTSMLRDVPSMGIPKALKENGFENVSEEMQQEVAEFLTHLKNMPTEYFEVKILRDVAITEFSGAVVPKNVDSRVLDVLKKNGVKDIRYYDESTPGNRQEVIGQFENLLFQKAEQQARGQISFSNDITQGANITLLKNADASTFIHELGHFFLEVYADVASKPDAPQVIVDDMNQLFNWFGIESTEQPAIDVWRNMNIEQKRFYHEKLARGFEQYAMEGTAPTLELSRVFAKLRSFMLSAYKSLKQFFERSGEPGLTPEVRQVFDRMLASEDAINKAQAVRGMMPMFASMEEAGMSVDEYAEYLQNQQDATDEAKTQLTARSLRDMKWLQGARSRVLRDLQRQADAERRAVRMQVRREVMTQPVYQAYSWLKQIPDESKAQQAEKVKATKGVDVEKDSLYTAIAKLGGLNRELAASEWGIDPKDKFDSGVFGKPVLRKEGGLSPDAMAEALAQYEYLTVDENGKWDLREFEDKFFEEARGERQYSLFAEGEQYRKWQESIYDEQERVRLDSFGKGKLDLNSMKAMYGEEGDWRNLGIGRTGMVMTDGVAPDAVAELFGFNSGDHLVKSLLAAENPKALVERLTNERMLAEFGDLVDAKKMNEAADKAVHNEVRARVLATELSAQNKALGNRRLLDAAAREYAQQKIAQKTVKDIKPYIYVRAEEKAAKLVEKATKQGDIQTAVQAKRDVLLNNRTAKEAFAAQDEIEKYIDKVRKLNKSSVQSNMRGEPLVQMLSVLERFDFRTGISNAQLAEMRGKEPLAQWVEKEAERLVAVIPDLPDFVLDETYRKSYKDMTLAELRELMGAVTQLEQLARRENKQYKEIRNQSFQEEKATILEQIKKTYPQLFDAEGNIKADIPSLVVKLEDKLANNKDGMLAGYLNITAMAEILDGGQTNGVVFESLFGRYSEASNYKSNRLSEIYAELKPYLKDQYSLAERRAFSRKDIGTSTVGLPLTRENAVVAVALYGSAEGRQRLSNWFDAGQMQQVIDLLDQRDIELVKTLWRVSDEMIWPELEAVNNRTKGISPPKVKGVAFDTKYGTLEGGYFHLDYRSADNPEKGVQVQTFDASKSLDELRAGIGMSRATRQGTSKERVTQSNLRPNLHLDVFSNAVNETLHDIAFREALADTMRLLNDNQIALALKKSLGEKHYKAITQRVSEIAIPQYNPTGMLEKAFSIARKNTVAVLLSGMTTALQNFTGIFPALTKVKAGLVAKNLIKFYSPAMTKNINFALESSPYIKSRLLNGYDRDVQGMIKEFTVNGRVLPDTKYALILMGLVDAGVSIPVWTAAFEQRMAETGNDTDASVKFADAVIQTTMGSGRDVDQSAMVSGKGAMNAFKQMFLMFFNYFQAQGQRLVVAGAISKQEWNSGNRANAVANFTVKYMFIVALPAIITEFLFGWGDDDDDEYMKRAIESTVFFQTAMVPLVRDVARPIWNQFDEDVKSFGYKMSPVESAIQMAIQTPGSVMDLMEGNGDDKDIKRAIMGVSFVTAMPGKLISDVTLGTKAFMEGDAGPQAIIVGPPKD